LVWSAALRSRKTADQLGASVWQLMAPQALKVFGRLGDDYLFRLGGGQLGSSKYNM